MNKLLVKNKKTVIAIGILFCIVGVLLAYLKWGIEPEETIAGFLCGIGFSITILGLGIKKEQNNEC